MVFFRLLIVRATDCNNQMIASPYPTMKHGIQVAPSDGLRRAKAARLTWRQHFEDKMGEHRED